MKVQHYQPVNEILRQHIEFYYFLKTDDEDFKTEYYAFPNLLTSLNIHANVSVDISDHAIDIVGGNNVRNKLAIIQGLRKQPLRVSLRGKIDKVTIVFKPLGLAAFVSRPVSQICPRDSQIFSEWDRDANTQEFFERFFSTRDIPERVDILEKLLLSRYKPAQDRSAISKAIRLLTDFEDELTVDDIAAEVGLSVRTLSRNFTQNVGISPAGFKKIARFRHSLQNMVVSGRFERLTDLAYNSNFYDQSYFVNIYKQMTGSNPKHFFDNIEKVGADKLLFQFIDK